MQESYSSAGGTPVLFDTAGNSIAPDVRPQPRFVAIDGVSVQDGHFPGSHTDSRRGRSGQGAAPARRRPGESGVGEVLTLLRVFRMPDALNRTPQETQKTPSPLSSDGRSAYSSAYLLAFDVAP